MADEPKIVFKKLNGFPAITETDKIETAKFLEAAKEVVSVIESFGKLFAPVAYDMNGNIEKLTQIYIEDESKFLYLEDLVMVEEENKKLKSQDSLLWLKRALEMIEQFFTNILNDKSCKESLKHHIEAAYCVTLKQYHNWFIQKSFAVVYTLLPYRSQLVGQGEIHNENMESLSEFLPTMRLHLQRIDSLLSQ